MPRGRSAMIVVNFGSHDLLSRHLDRSAEGIDDVVVVDSFHSDAERASMEQLADERGWHLVAPADNVGFGGGVNLGADRARALGAEVLVLVNPDAQLGAGAAIALVDAARAQPMHLVAPVISRPDGGFYSRGRVYLSLDDGLMRSSARPPRSERERPWLSGACLALSWKLWEQVGGFDEEYFLYWEDVDFSIRVQDAGGELEVIEGLDIVHDEGATHRQGGPARVKSETYYYYNIRNRLRYAARALSEQDRRRWRRTSFRAARAIVLQGGRRQLVHSIAPWRAAWRGTRDGLRDLAGVSADAHPARRATQKRSVDDLRLVVAIPTFKRPGTLALNLRAVSAQAAALTTVGGRSITARVVVVDNDPDASARETVAEIGTDIDYMHEPTPGIAAVRNRSLDMAADDDLVVFIDDDEAPHDNWLQAMVDTWDAHDADAVWGKVLSVFDGPIDPWIEAGEFFVRKARRTGDRLDRAATNNLLLDMHTVQRLGLRFDERLGLGGGEDTLFSQQLVAGGGTIRWCDEAVVDDLVPASRATRRWVLARKMSHGNVGVRVDKLRVGRGPRRYAVAARATVGGAVRVGYGGLQYVAGRLVRSPRLESRGARVTVRGIGMAAGGLGLRYEEYSRSTRLRDRWQRDRLR